MKIKLFLMTAIMSLTFTSCVEVEEPTILYGMPYYVVPTYVMPGTTNAQGQSAIAFNSYSNGQATRAYVNTNSNLGYDDFSLYVWTKDSVVMDSWHTQWVTNGWTYVGVDGQQLKYFDNFVDEYNFIGIIPQTTEQISNGKVTLEVEGFTVDNETTTDTPKEFLYATTTVGNAQYAQGATMNFRHGNAKVYLKFTSDDAETEIMDYTPYTPANLGSPAIPSTPGTETYTTQQVNFIDELVAGNTVQVGIGFVGASSPKLTKTNPTTLYVGSNNATYNYYAKDWLLSIMDEVNAQFVYYKLDQVANSTSKAETTEDWESAASNKNIFMMKLAPSVNPTDFANGDDAFATALKAHQTDWVGGSTPEPFWAMFEQAYAQGWRVIRINVSDANANQVMVFLSSNQTTNSQVCTVTGGTPAVPAVPATPESGVQGIVVLPATSTLGNGTDAVLATYPTKANVEVSLNGLAWTATQTSNVVKFTKPTTKVTSNNTSSPIASPTAWYTLPCNDANVGYTIKFSYRYKGVDVYDARVFIPASECQWQEGKYYTYIIQINGRGNGHATPNNPDADDPTIENSQNNNEIRLFLVEFSDYGDGGTVIKTIN